MTKLIGLGGKLAAGKDSVADRLVSEHDWAKLNMSSPLHAIVTILNPWIHLPQDECNLFFQKNQIFITEHYMRYTELVDLVGYTLAKEFSGVREFLQVMGTEVGRENFGEDVWVDLAATSIKGYLDQGISVAITGIRFPNEVDMIHRLGGQLVWVDRPIKAAGGGGVSSHASETMGPDDFDLVLDNSGTLEDLYDKVEALA